MTGRDSDKVEVLRDVLKENGLDEESRLFRYTLPEFLQESGESNNEASIYRLTANDDSSEAVEDVYGQGHGVLARHVGAGLAFCESPDNQWNEGGRVCVEVRLGDVLDQGGLLYPVQSVITERTWYLTLPEGSVAVRPID